MEKTKITLQEFYNFITSQMTAEQALMTLLASPLINYENLKFKSQEESVHPLLIMAMAAMDMGWSIVVEKPDDEKVNVDGLLLGTPEYIKKMLKE